MGAASSVFVGNAKCKGEKGTQLLSFAPGLIDVGVVIPAIVAGGKPATLDLQVKNSLFQIVDTQHSNLITTSDLVLMNSLIQPFTTMQPAGTYSATIRFQSPQLVDGKPVDETTSIVFIVEEPSLEVKCDNCSKKFGMCSTFGVLSYCVRLVSTTLTKVDDDEVHAFPKTLKIEILNACSSIVYTKTFANVLGASDLINDLPSGVYTVRATSTNTLNETCVLQETCCIRGPEMCCLRSTAGCSCKK